MRSMMANGTRVLPACPPISATVDPEVRQFVISQLVVIARYQLEPCSASGFGC